MSIPYVCFHNTSWIMNSNGHYNSFFGALTDVVSVSQSTSSWTIHTNRIPNYQKQFLASDVTALNARPKASTDFRTNSRTTATAGSSYEFGADIGYSTRSCSRGYWPPGPSCPTASTTSKSFTLLPAPELRSGGCYAPMAGSLGTWVNGVAIFGWSDVNSYNSANVWYNLAPIFEVYDMDVCNGHAANGEYHHHHYPICLQEKLKDVGSGHSPVYGWISDGYPIYGPYQGANKQLAQSCWQKRDYSSSSVTGCSNGQRCCVLNDPEDYTKGVTSATCGPSLTSTVSSLSQNSISAASGAYLGDYFFNSSCSRLGGVHLDKHNGHNHDGYGYHYHFTIDSTGSPVFPFLIGPKFYGCRSGVGCCTSAVGRPQSCAATSVCGASDGESPVPLAGTYTCSTSEVISGGGGGSTINSSQPTTSPTTSPSQNTAGDDDDDASLSTSTIITIAVCGGGGLLLLGIGVYVIKTTLLPSSVGVAGNALGGGNGVELVPTADHLEANHMGQVVVAEAEYEPVAVAVAI